MTTSAHKIVIANQKGGVGKTATALALSAFLAGTYGKTVLAIDLDASSNMTIGFGINPRTVNPSLTEVLEQTCSPEDATVRITANLHLLPARPDLAITFNYGKLSQHRKKNEIAKFVLGEHQKKYDWIIIDTGPQPQNVMTVNGLAFADSALIPVQMEELSVYGITEMIETIKSMHHQWINQDIKILGLLPTLYQKTTVHKKNLYEISRSPQSRYLFNTIIRKTASIPAALSKSQLITAMPKTAGYIDYLSLTEEIIAKTEAADATN